MDNKTSMLMMMHTLTSAHPGSGTELSFVDLPIQRETHTGYPKIEASTLKGCIRKAISEHHKNEKEEITKLFGSFDEGSFASAVSFSDARLLFFPVKSAFGTFAWVTCPYAVQRFLTDYKLTFKDHAFKEIKSVPGEAVITEDSGLFPNGMERLSDKIILESYTYRWKKDGSFKEFVEQIVTMLPENNTLNDRFLQHVALLPDDDFVNFVKYSTEINERIKIDSETGTVSDTVLFSEEYLPPECIFYSLLFFHQEYCPQDNRDNSARMKAEAVQKEFEKLFDFDVFQIGADKTLGKGLVSKKLCKEEKDGATGK